MPVDNLARRGNDNEKWMDDDFYDGVDKGWDDFVIMNSTDILKHHYVEHTDDEELLLFFNLRKLAEVVLVA